jgi:hypothetical protein
MINIGYAFEFEVSFKEYYGPAKETVVIHALNATHAEEYLTGLGYFDLRMISKW